MKGKLLFQLVIFGGLAGSVIAAISPPSIGAQSAVAQRYFAETKHTVAGEFWNYWQQHGGLAQQGYPISEEFAEVSDLDGKIYTVQYFERAVFEKHPENKAPYDVLLSQLGTLRYKAKYEDAGGPDQKPNSQGGQLFKETGHLVGGIFLDYWKAHGGIIQQGLPISDEFTEASDQDGKTYTVQYFERATFEAHPENQPPYNVLLSQLGTFRAQTEYPSGMPEGNTPQPTETAVKATRTPGQQAPTPNTQATHTATAGKPTPTPVGTPTKVAGSNCSPPAVGLKSKISSTGPVQITKIEYIGEESVEITNKGQAPADISDWSLRNKNHTSKKFTFLAGTTLNSGTTVQVYTSPGHTYSFNNKSSIWNNCGASVELLDKNGSVVSTFAYGTYLLP